MGIITHIARTSGLFALVLLLVTAADSAFARTPCTQQSMAHLVHDLQTGQLVLGAFAPELQRNLLDETRGTLRDPRLAKLGQVKNIRVIGVKPASDGTVCGFETVFNDASVIWQLSYDPDGVIKDLDYAFDDKGGARR